MQIGLLHIRLGSNRLNLNHRIRVYDGCYLWVSFEYEKSYNHRRAK